MRGFLSILGVCAALVMCAVSGAMNYLFLSSLGKTPLEGQVLGAASAASDVLKALLPIFVTWAWVARRYVAAALGTLTFIFFAGFALLSAIGFAADNRGILVEGREARSGEYNRVFQHLKETQGKLAGLLAHRPSTVVAEEIERHKQNRRWSATKSCTDATEPESRSFCERYFALRAEHATGVEAEQLETAVQALTSEAKALRDGGAANDADPQVTLLARIFGVPEDRVRLALIVVVALLVEIGASLGLFLATGHGPARQKTHAEDSSNEISVASAPAEPANDDRPLGSVEDFVLEALVPASGRLDEQELLRAYLSWCAKRGFDTLSEEEFADLFNQLAEAVGIRRLGSTYQSIAILGTPNEGERQAA